MCATGFSGILLIKCKNKIPLSCLCNTVTTPTKCPHTFYKNPTDIKCASDQPHQPLWFPRCSQTGKWVMYLKCILHAACESLMHNGGRCSPPPPFLALQPRQCFCTTLRFRHHCRSCGCSSVTERQANGAFMQMFIPPHRRSFSVMFYRR